MMFGKGMPKGSPMKKMDPAKGKMKGKSKPFKKLPNNAQPTKNDLSKPAEKAQTGGKPWA
jgi:hypothetical protein